MVSVLEETVLNSKPATIVQVQDMITLLKVRILRYVH
jgi:hypothetical protein